MLAAGRGSSAQEGEEMRPPPPSPLLKQRPHGQRRPAPPCKEEGMGKRGRDGNELRLSGDLGVDTERDTGPRHPRPTPRSRCVPAAPVPGCQLATINDRPGRQSGRTLRGAVAEDAVVGRGGAVVLGHPALRDGAVCESIRPSVRSSTGA